VATAALRDSLIDVIVPVHDEESTLRTNIDVLVDYLAHELPFRWRVTIADNASRDATPRIAAELAGAHPDIHLVRLERKGRGLALRTAWGSSPADVVSYMDVDLSTNLESFLPLVAPIVSGHSELAIGSRLARQSRVRRQIKREVLSRGYNGLVRAGFRCGFSDAQCGFKAIRADIARLLLPHVVDDGWFFDTELLLLAERNGLRIHEVPVDWVEDLDSRVALLPTMADDLRGLWRVRRAYLRGAGHVTAVERPEPVVAR
jgi:glycosyltransferase involved in cell wall biosynthesis